MENTMDLPLADEIRETRRIAMESTEAAVHLNRVRGILNALALLDRQLTIQPDADYPLPGDDLVEDICERWPSLSDLTTIGPRPTQSFREQLRSRRQQMEAAQQILGPLAKRQSTAADELHELQHKQAHLLEDPKFAEAVAELGTLKTKRDRVASELQPMYQHVNTVASLHKLAVTFLARIDATIETANAQPESAALRATAIVGSLVTALAQVRDSLELAVELPGELEIPDQTDPEHHEKVFAEVDRIRAGIASTIEALENVIATHKGKVDTLQQRLEEVQQQLIDRMG
jgi:chromosome segregation ATPase